MSGRTSSTCISSFAGEEKDYDELLVRGNKDEDSFIVMYLKDARLRAYLAVNTSPRSFIPMQRMIRQRFDLGGIKAQLPGPGRGFTGAVPVAEQLAKPPASLPDSAQGLCHHSHK